MSRKPIKSSGLGFASSAGLFAKRGDPWITSRESMKDFGHNPDSPFNNPDLDRYTKAAKAARKKIMGHDKPIQKKSDVASASRKRANILRKMHKRLRELEERKHGR